MIQEFSGEFLTLYPYLSGLGTYAKPLSSELDCSWKGFRLVALYAFGVEELATRHETSSDRILGAIPT